MRIYLLFSIACILSLSLQAQPWAAKNSLYIDFGDVYQVNYAVNYNRIIFQKELFTLSASVGVSVEPVDYSSFWQPLFPIEATIFTGNRKHHLEGGITFTPGLYYNSYIYSDYLVSKEPIKVITRKDIGTTVGFRIGYRFQKPAGGFFFRTSFIPTLYSSFIPFYLTYMDAGKDGCVLCVYAEPSSKHTGLVPGISFSVGKSF